VLRLPATRHIVILTGLMKGSGMAVWHKARTIGWQARAVIAAVLLAVLLVAAVPVALLAGLVMMLLGHIAGGLALFGASVLAAAVAVVIAGLSGVRHLRKLAGQRGYRVVQLRPGDYHFD
jgi:uncharacterized membrane protein YdjX (TVP38/TMEM64 family)